MSSCSCYPAVKDGHEFNHFIGNVFSQCVYTPIEMTAFVIGMSSLGFWMACQVPQFIKNYRKKSAKSLSKWFLLEWFLGDILNLIGALLTHQLVTQVATGVLFLIVDVTMISQLTYYSYIYPKSHGVLSQRLLSGDRPADFGSNDNAPDTGFGGSFEDEESQDEVMHRELRTARNLRGNGTGEEHNSGTEDASHDNGNESSSSSTQGRQRQSRTLLSTITTVPIGLAMCVTVQLMATGAAVTPSSSNGATMELQQQFESRTVHNAVEWEATNPLVSNLVEDTASWGVDFSTHSKRRNLAHVTSVVPRDCSPPVHLSKEVDATGHVLGWVSAVVYLNSRIPQILKNFRRKSVAGLSWVMFFCAVMGNVTYGLGVVLHDSSPKALTSAAPWLVGSLGTLTLDFIIITQFYWYSGSKQGSGYQSVATRDAPASVFAESPAHGLFGINAWTNSPFFRPQLARRGGNTYRQVMQESTEDDSTSNLAEDDNAV